MNLHSSSLNKSSRISLSMKKSKTVGGCTCNGRGLRVIAIFLLLSSCLFLGCRSKKLIVNDHVVKRDSSQVLQISADSARWQENSADSVREYTEFVRDSCGQIVAIHKTRVAYHQKDGKRFRSSRLRASKTALTVSDSTNLSQRYFSTKDSLSKGSFHSQKVAKGEKIVFIVAIILLIAIITFSVVKRGATIRRLIKLTFKH